MSHIQREIIQTLHLIKSKEEVSFVEDSGTEDGRSQVIIDTYTS